MLDAEGFGADPFSRALALFAAGADWLQLRDRRLGDAALLALARDLVRARDDARMARASRGAGRLRVVVNRRADVAWAAGADGVHLGFDALSPAAARALLGRDAIVGRSLHAVAEVEAAARQEPELDYVHLAPIWNPNSKPAERPALGVEHLAAATRAGLPVFAQGGLDAERASEAVAVGAAGVAVTGRLAVGTNPAEVLEALRKNLDGSS